MPQPLKISFTLNATAEKIWHALTDKEAMKIWYFDIPDFELKVGAVFNFYEPGGANKYHHQCTITEIVPNEKFQHTWTHPSHSKGSSILTWNLQQQNDGTIVTLIHEGLENFADGGKDFVPENYEAGWNELVGKSLRDFVEKN